MGTPVLGVRPVRGPLFRSRRDSIYVVLVGGGEVNPVSFVEYPIALNGNDAVELPADFPPFVFPLDDGMERLDGFRCG